MLWIINRTVSKDGGITEIMHVKCLACGLSQDNYSYELNIFVLSLQSYIETIALSVMELGGGPIGGDEVMRMEPS